MAPSVMHVVPKGDLIEHELSDDCVCLPDPRFTEGGLVLVHHSLDGREAQEPDHGRML